ncbi:MAG: septal ring lytic transglycosylase RlpA family protein [Burkholderiales bacterium]
MLRPVLRFCAAVVLIAALSPTLAQKAAGDARPEASLPARPGTDANTKRASTATTDARGAVETGMASVYADDLEGQATASGALYDPQKLTAAHRALPLGSRIRVVDVGSGKSVVVTVNDRWGGGPGQVVNLSRRAADELGMRGSGQRKVEITVEAIGDGRRQAASTGGAPLLLPERIDAVPTDRGGRSRICANEADILGLRDALWESHVRNCLQRKPKAGEGAAEASTK